MILHSPRRDGQSLPGRGPQVYNVPFWDRNKALIYIPPFEDAP